jgi:hypothetical protein
MSQRARIADRERRGFFAGANFPSVATRVSVFFRSFIAKITLTLLADSERLPSKFRARVDGFVCAPS